jgi:hypothetical protein
MLAEAIQLIIVGLTDDLHEIDVLAAKLGEEFAAGAAIVHHQCAERLSDLELEIFVASLVPMVVAA